MPLIHAVKALANDWEKELQDMPDTSLVGRARRVDRMTMIGDLKATIARYERENNVKEED